MTWNPCVLCRCDLADAVPITDHCRNGFHAPRVACFSCGLVQRVPMPSAEEVRDYYVSGRYRQENPDHQAPDGGNVRYAAFVAAAARGRRVLEVGAGRGRLAAQMAALGLDVTAAEPDRNLWSPRPFEWLEEVPESGAYDAIVLAHVLEHQPDPVSFLRRLRTLAAPGCALIVEVPSVLEPYGDLPTWFFQYGHLVDLHPGTLAATCVLAGWEPEQVLGGKGIDEALGAHPNWRTCACMVLARPGEEREPDWDKLRGGAWIAGYLEHYTRSRA